MQEILNPILNNPLVKLSENLCILFYVVFWLALVFWTYRDAERRGSMAWFWALVVFVFSIFGWAIYMVVRPPEYEEDERERELEIRAKELELALNVQQCSACRNPVEKDYLICPYCMNKLKKSCVNCGKALRLNWQVCPYCKTKQ